jgi:hypothetical protein
LASRLWIRIFRSLLFVLAAASFAVSGAAHAAATHPSTIQQKLASNGVGAQVKLVLAGNVKLHGTISAIDQNSVSILPKGATTTQIVPFATIVSVREPLRSRFKTGPCVDPITLAIAAPFILVAAATGH